MALFFIQKIDPALSRTAVLSCKNYSKIAKSCFLRKNVKKLNGIIQNMGAKNLAAFPFLLSHLTFFSHSDGAVLYADANFVMHGADFLRIRPNTRKYEAHYFRHVTKCIM